MFFFLFNFLELLFNAKTIPVKTENVLRHEKYSDNSENSRKISRDSLGHKQSK
jgi:hypothetical protein